MASRWVRDNPEFNQGTATPYKTDAVLIWTSIRRMDSWTGSIDGGNLCKSDIFVCDSVYWFLYGQKEVHTEKPSC